MPLHVTELQPSAHDAWEGYVDRHPQGTLFHTLMWRDAVETTFGHGGRYLCAWDGERLVGVFPLMEVASFLAGTLLVSVPYAVYGGALANDDDAKRALLSAAQELANELNAEWIDIRSVDVQWPALPVIKRYVTFRKSLPVDPAEVLQSMPRKARAAARQAGQRHALKGDFDDQHLRAVWSLYSKSMRRLASPNYPARFFKTLIERTGVVDSDARIRHLVQIVTLADRPVAGVVSFIFRGVLMPYFAGCDERFRHCHANNYMYLRLMERGAALGCREFDFGRTRVDNSGAYDFKRFQGFEPTPLHYQYYVPEGGRIPDLHPQNPKLSLARRVWPRLPLAVTRPLGSWLSKSIPG